MSYMEKLNKSRYQFTMEPKNFAVNSYVFNNIVSTFSQTEWILNIIKQTSEGDNTSAFYLGPTQFTSWSGNMVF